MEYSRLTFPIYSFIRLHLLAGSKLRANNILEI